MLTKAKLEHIGEFILEIATTGDVVSYTGLDINPFGASNVGQLYQKCFGGIPYLVDSIKGALEGKKTTFIPSENNGLPAVYFYPILEQDNIEGVVGIGLDAKNINQHIENTNAKLNYLQNYNKDLERFAYVASHDLHEPLRSVRSFIGLLEEEYEDVLTEDAKDYIAFAMNGTKRMQQLIDDLLHYNRIGEPNLPIKLMDIGKILELQVYKLNELISSKNATIDIGEHPAKIIGNSKQLAMVFYNLMQNALHFNKSENPHITIIGKETDHYYEFSVKDNGVGIPERLKNEVFEVFFKLNSPGESTGIGLAICKKVVQRHGGQIWLDSVLGEGSVFYFTIAKELMKY